MKSKLLLGMFIASTLSANAFAIDIYKGKIISDTQNLDAIPKAVFKDIKNDFKSQLMRKIERKKAYKQEPNEYISNKVSISSHEDGEVVGKEFSVSGATYVFIKNLDVKPRVYTIETSACFMSLKGGGSSGPCASNVTEISLQPEGFVDVARSIDFPVIAVKADTYQEVIELTITREDGETEYMSYADQYTYVRDGNDHDQGKH